MHLPFILVVLLFRIVAGFALSWFGCLLLCCVGVCGLAEKGSQYVGVATENSSSGTGPVFVSWFPVRRLSCVFCNDTVCKKGMELLILSFLICTQFCREEYIFCDMSLGIVTEYFCVVSPGVVTESVIF